VPSSETPSIRVPPPIDSPELAELAFDVGSEEPAASDDPNDKATTPPPAMSSHGEAQDDAELSLESASGEDEAPSPESIEAAGDANEGPALDEVDASDDGPSLDASEDEGPAIEASGDDDGPVFETDDSEETVLEVGGEEEVEVSARRTEDDRGAMLAATVTSRRRWLEPAEIAYAGDAKAEVEARAGLLEGEAEYADSPERKAEMLCIAGELIEGVLGDRARARALFERAYEAAPESPFVIRALRRLALIDGDVAHAVMSRAHARSPIRNVHCHRPKPRRSSWTRSLRNSRHVRAPHRRKRCGTGSRNCREFVARWRNCSRAARVTHRA
jgi:hypothetical protein